MINEDFESLKTFILTDEDLARHSVITEAPWNKGIPHTEETRKLMSELRRGKSPWNKGKPGIQKHSDETRKKISKAKEGNKNRLGKNHTNKSKQLMSKAKSGKSRSAEVRKKISDTMKAKKHGL
jgi:hypothetical protein